MSTRVNSSVRLEHRPCGGKKPLFIFLNNIVRMQVDLGHPDAALVALNAGLAVIAEPRSPVHSSDLLMKDLEEARSLLDLGRVPPLEPLE